LGETDGHNKARRDANAQHTPAMAASRKSVRRSANEPSGRQGETAAAFAKIPDRPLSRGEGPLYRQLATLLRQFITEGGLPIGAALPREADLARRCGVSLITVRHALRELEGEGLIKKRAAKQAIVAAPNAAVGSNFTFKSFAEIAASTRDRRLEINSYRREKSAIAAKAFGLAPGEAAYCLKATLFLRDLPTNFITFYFPPAVGARMKRTDFDDVVVFRSVQRHLGIALSRAQITVRAENASAALAQSLDYEEGAPVLIVEMLYFATDGSAVELTISRNRADLFSLTYEAPNDLL
jgi:GntR family transcriptional regulator